ncbi:MAG: F0F1 ATP synthase subunit gamma, partial [Anaerolineae bacterium]|nr:F0F1 ATP synthase subunit gamma [Anaerolineae bacterium]
RRFTALQVYQAILESLASEHAARMVAMRNASENSDTLVEGLTLVYNKVRQQSITSEILDIVGGVEALKSAPKPKEDKGSDNAVYDSGRSLTEQVSSVLDSVIKAADEQLEKITSALRGDDEDEEDDLTLIEGIGEKVAGALKTSGIKTFKQLAEAAAAELERLVKEVHGVRMVGSAATWSKQAQYILDGDMDGLKAYQTRLVSGREK